MKIPGHGDIGAWLLPSVSVKRTCVMLAAILLFVGAAMPAAEPSREHQLKAAFLYNFTKYVEWPHERSTINQPLVIGVFGSSPVEDALTDVIRERKAAGREVVVKSVQTVEQARTVHALFVGENTDGQLPALLEALRGHSILTVGETATFGKHGGVIVFVPAGDKLRFTINASSAEAAGLKISSQLLKLAKQAR